MFQLRDQANPDAEKPFLEHLEDLRVCITRILLTLLITTLACFFFRHELMTIIRRPIDQVWERTQSEALDPEETGITSTQWEVAKVAADIAPSLPEPQREHFFQKISEDDGDIRENVQVVHLYRATLAIEGTGARETFVREMPGLEDAMRSKLLALLKGTPSADSDARMKAVFMQALKPTEGFMLSIKLSIFAGLVVAFPFLLYFILQFVLPGMHESERRALWPAMAIGFGLFLGGVFFSYYIVLPRVLEFFHSYSSDMQIENVWRIGYYISFATTFTLIFGLAFELPVVVMTLVKLGIMNSAMMRRTRSYAILAIFVIAAIITPTPDAVTLCFLALPMVFLYEICIWLAVLLESKQRKREAAEEKERMERLLARRERLAAEDEKGAQDHDPDDDDPDPDHDPDGGPDGDHDPDQPDPHHGGESHERTPNEEYESGDDEHQWHDEPGPSDGHDPDHFPEHPDYDAIYESESGAATGGDEADSEAEPDHESAPGAEGGAESEADRKLRQSGFEFHEESDPALHETEEGEQEDISDPWPASGAEGASGDENENENESEDGDEQHVDPLHPPEDIPEEERNREDNDLDRD